jgi:CDP-6-deoxy-D-xylo-4-hexulose-3-dehydrase
MSRQSSVIHPAADDDNRLKEKTKEQIEMTHEEIRKQILELTKQYYTEKYTGQKFIPGQSPVHYAGRVFNDKELSNLVDASLDFWLTEGRYSEEFAGKISEFLGVENVLLTNSGSSANLLAFAALTSEKLGGRRLQPGDEVISVAAGFPSTVAPILQYQCVPVFVDVEIPTYNIDVQQIESAISEKTKCIFLAHTLGNPFNLDAVLKIAEKYKLWFIEDNCDAFGSTYKGRYTGTFGHLSTLSFYPAHHITTGEGGAVLTNDDQLAKLVRAFRDWGRDCYCAGGENNTCGKRFSQQFGTLPFGYDHKYVYSEVGYNLKMTDMQAAVGAAQMDKLQEFCSRRRKNFQRCNRIFQKHEQYFILPGATKDSDPAWFTYIATVKKSAPFKREELTRFLNEQKVETRNLFAGNMIRQPALAGRNCRVSGTLANTEDIMNHTFFLGTYPGMTDEMLDYLEETLNAFVKRF